MAFELLASSQMQRVDQNAMRAGIAGLTLMEQAGVSVFEEIRQQYPDAQTFLIVCGPGNNGGDGFVVARHLKQAGLQVRVLFFGDIHALQGDAAEMAKQWSMLDGTSVETLNTSRLEDVFRTLPKIDIIIDALFGTGLTRDIDGDLAQCIQLINSASCRVVCVDTPSGLDATTGLVLGVAVQADMTVTFCRRKIGQVLLPGRELCGDLHVADIGIPDRAVQSVDAQISLNHPELWLDVFPEPKISGHKYDRGHAVVVSGPMHATGAARLGAMAALRSGAGLVTVASPKDAVSANAAHLTSVMIHPLLRDDDLEDFLQDKRRNAVLIGPGAGVGVHTQKNVQTCLHSGAHVVLDADAITSFADQRQSLFKDIVLNPERHVIMTPHEGEFRRLFEVETSLSAKLEFEAKAKSKVDRAVRAAQEAGCVIVLKGPDTVIASPDGRAVVNDNAPPWLATAGSGDVLAGIVTGLLAQHMPAFEAACAGVWLHGAAAHQSGFGMIAEDLPDLLLHVLSKKLYAFNNT